MNASTGWLRKAAALRHYQTGWRRVDEYVRQGWVRSAKLGEGRNSTRLYSAQDLDRVLSDLAAGRKPRRAGGRAGR